MVEGDKSVVVCAPTGAGKTAIAEAAAAATLARGLRVIYTTPLKVGEIGRPINDNLTFISRTSRVMHWMPYRTLFAIQISSGPEYLKCPRSNLQALSNQKLGEVRRRFGHGRCGLQTGDTSLNTEADIVIMTTEILRNIMYRTAETSSDSTASEAPLGPG